MSKYYTARIRSMKRILVVSTRTRDRLPTGPGERYRILPGGPAYYMSVALKELGAPFHILTNQSVDVEVVGTSGGEAYIIPPIDPIPLPQRLEGSAVILSPVIGELDPAVIPPVDGLLVVDVQGFVRQPNVRSDRALGPFNLSPLLSRAHLVKAAEDEIELLDDASRLALARTTTLITGGSRGARILRPGSIVHIDANPVEAPHTIGAGDTFLAAMTYALVLGQSAEAAAADAARFTEQILRSRRDVIQQG